MAINYTEKRNFIRIPINHEMTYKVDGSNAMEQGVCINLSADGVMFSASKKFDPGTIIDINITPKQSVVTPLDAMVEVVRVSENEVNDQFTVAGIIKVMN